MKSPSWDLEACSDLCVNFQSLHQLDRLLSRSLLSIFTSYQSNCHHLFIQPRQVMMQPSKLEDTVGRTIPEPRAVVTTAQNKGQPYYFCSFWYAQLQALNCKRFSLNFNFSTGLEGRFNCNVTCLTRAIWPKLDRRHDPILLAKSGTPVESEICDLQAHSDWVHRPMSERQKPKQELAFWLSMSMAMILSAKLLVTKSLELVKSFATSVHANLLNIFTCTECSAEYLH